MVGNGLSEKSGLLRESSLSGALQLRARPENKGQDGGRPSPWLGGGGTASWEMGVLGLMSKAPGFCIDLRCFILLYRVKVSHLKIMFTNHNTHKDKAT